MTHQQIASGPVPSPVRSSNIPRAAVSPPVGPKSSNYGLPNLRPPKRPADTNNDNLRNNGARKRPAVKEEEL